MNGDAKQTTDRAPSDGARHEVQNYLVRMLALMVIGIFIMAVTAIWAWKRYGAPLEEAPPLPSGTPALPKPPSTSP